MSNSEQEKIEKMLKRSEEIIGIVKRIKVGDVVQHFKRKGWLAKEYGPEMHLHMNDMTYMYYVEAIATHTETKEKLVIYKALYTNNELGVKKGDVFARPYDMFMSKVDKFKYPNVEQEYRFEQC